MVNLVQRSANQTGALVYEDLRGEIKVFPLFSDNLVRETVQATKNCIQANRYIGIYRPLNELEREELVRRALLDKTKIRAMNQLRSGFQESKRAGMLNSSIEYYR